MPFNFKSSTAILSMATILSSSIIPAATQATSFPFGLYDKNPYNPAVDFELWKSAAINSLEAL